MAEFTHTYAVNCPSCGGSSVVKSGLRNGKQRYKCQGCGKKFRQVIRVETIAEGRKYSDETIGAAIFQYFLGGMSIRNIGRNISFREDLPQPSTDTIFQWAKDYLEAATYATRDVKAQTGDEWVADEMVIKVDGRNMYHWNIMDKDTRYLLASHISESRGAEEAIKVVQKALDRAARPPKKFRSDKYAAYPVALRYLMPYTKHIRTAGVDKWVNNNLSERMQNTFRARDKTLRGMYTVESGQQFLDGFTFTYNHFRDHMSLNDKTPGEVAGMEIPFTEWADVVRANIEVPEEWKREAKVRTPRKKDHGHTSKGHRKRAKKERVEPVNGVQLGMWRKKKPSKADLERVDAYARAQAPKPPRPDMGRKQEPEYDTQPRLFRKPRIPIPKHRVRPKPPGIRR